jgi:hypothetical protein
MPRLGLGTSLSAVGLPTVSHVTDNLKMLHRYNAGSVVPVSDGAAFFSGTTSYIDIVGSEDVTEGASALTLSLWIFPTGAEDSQYNFITKGGYNDTDSSWTFNWGPTASPGGRIRFSNEKDSGAGGAGKFWYTNSMNQYMPQNKWTHVAVTYDKTQDSHDEDGVFFYINGVKHSAAVSNGSFVDIQASDKKIQIGGDDGGTTYFQGYICNAAIWEKSLTQSQIKSIMFKNYVDLIDSEKTNLISWWNLDEETDVDGTSGTGGVKDSHVTNHGTLV